MVSANNAAPGALRRRPSGGRGGVQGVNLIILILVAASVTIAAGLLAKTVNTARSIDGIQTLATLKTHVGNRLQVMAGGGVRVEDIGALLAAGLDAVHLSAKVAVADPSPSGPGGGAQSYDQTDGDIAAAAAAAVLAATLEA